MSTQQVSYGGQLHQTDLSAADLSWYAVHVRARHEKKITASLRNKGFDAYVPLFEQVHRWSDRNMKVESPVFPCYLFVRVAAVERVMDSLFQSSGFLGIVGGQGKGTPIPDEQIAAIRLLLQAKLPFKHAAFPKIGQRVRVSVGPLLGVQGMVTGQKNDRWIILSVDAIQGSLAVCVDGYNVQQD